MEHIQFGSTLATVEREYILDTLAHCDGNRTNAAKLLGISLRCLRIKRTGDLHCDLGPNVTASSLTPEGPAPAELKKVLQSSRTRCRVPDN
jgi:hypothetical protein